MGKKIGGNSSEMNTQFFFQWIKKGQLLRKAFKSENTLSLVDDYIKRINHFTSCSISQKPLEIESKSGPSKLWVCERKKGSKILSSEALAYNIEKLLQSGVKELKVVIGGADGFSEKELEIMKPDLKWSFGELTLPHELAAVVAVEQIYRAWTILKKHPYHSGH